VKGGRLGIKGGGGRRNEEREASIDVWCTLFLPLSGQAADQLYDLDVILTENLENPESPDSWEYNWGNTYLPKKAYNHLQGKVDASPIYISGSGKEGTLESTNSLSGY